MLPYIFILIILLLFGLFYYYAKNKVHIAILSITILVILSIFSGFRGPFTRDYLGYMNLFDHYMQFSLTDLFRQNFGQEIGFVALNIVLSRITTNSVILFIVSSIITNLLFLKTFRKLGKWSWILIYLYVTIGLYYTSFNLVRQIMATAIIFASFENIINRNFAKFLIYLSLASLVHLTSLVMLPVYFLVNFKKRGSRLVIFTLFLLIWLFLSPLLQNINQLIYTHYNLNWYGFEGFSFNNVVLPFSLTVLAIIIYYLSDRSIKTKPTTLILINFLLLYFFTSLIGLQAQILIRISYFFITFVLYFIVYMISKMHFTKQKMILVLIIIVFSTMFNIVTISGSGYDPYSFISLLLDSVFTS